MNLIFRRSGKGSAKPTSHPRSIETILIQGSYRTQPSPTNVNTNSSRLVPILFIRIPVNVRIRIENKWCTYQEAEFLFWIFTNISHNQPYILENPKHGTFPTISHNIDLTSLKIYYLRDHNLVQHSCGSNLPSSSRNQSHLKSHSSFPICGKRRKIKCHSNEKLSNLLAGLILASIKLTILTAYRTNNNVLTVYIL